MMSKIKECFANLKNFISTLDYIVNESRQKRQQRDASDDVSFFVIQCNTNGTFRKIFAIFSQIELACGVTAQKIEYEQYKLEYYLIFPKKLKNSQKRWYGSGNFYPM